MEGASSTQPKLSGFKDTQPLGETASSGDAVVATSSIFKGSIFPDADKVKQAIKENLQPYRYVVTSMYKEHGLSQKIARSEMFDHTTMLMIVINAVWIAIDTDNNFADLLVDAQPEFIIAENIFCAYFTWEVSVRFLAFEKKCNALKDFWFSFDSVVVSFMIFETWILSIIAMLTSSASSTTILSLVRLLRLSRMIKVVRVLRAFPEILILLHGMRAAVRSVFFTLCLLGILTYVYAVAFSALAKDSTYGAAHFRDVPLSMYTLIVRGVLLDEISALLDEIGLESTLVVGLFLTFVLVASVTVMNLLIGVLCEVVNVVAKTEREEILIFDARKHLERVVKTVDSDGNGMISPEEMRCVLQNKQACIALQAVGVDPVSLIDLSDHIFDDQRNHEISFEQFLEELLLLRGQNTATFKDVTNLKKVISHQQAIHAHSLEKLNQKLDMLLGSGSDSTLDYFHGRHSPSKLKSELKAVDALKSNERKAERSGEKQPSDFAEKGLPKLDSRNGLPSAWIASLSESIAVDLSKDLEKQLSLKLLEMHDLLNQAFANTMPKNEDAGLVSNDDFAHREASATSGLPRHPGNQQLPGEVAKSTATVQRTIPGEHELLALEEALGLQEDSDARKASPKVTQDTDNVSTIWNSHFQEASHHLTKLRELGTQKT